MEGNLNKALNIEQTGDENLKVFSSDIKAKKIADKYGLDVYNINEEEKEEIIGRAANEAVLEVFEEMYG